MRISMTTAISQTRQDSCANSHRKKKKSSRKGRRNENCQQRSLHADAQSFLRCLTAMRPRNRYNTKSVDVVCWNKNGPDGGNPRLGPVQYATPGVKSTWFISILSAILLHCWDEEDKIDITGWDLGAKKKKKKKRKKERKRRYVDPSGGMPRSAWQVTASALIVNYQQSRAFTELASPFFS